MDTINMQDWHRYYKVDSPSATQAFVSRRIRLLPMNKHPNDVPAAGEKTYPGVRRRNLFQNSGSINCVIQF